MFHRFKTAWRGPWQTQSNLYEWVPLSLVPWDAAKLLLQPTGINLTVPIGRRIAAVISRLGFDSIDTALIDDPRMYGISAILNADRTIYRATDLYAELRGDKWILAAERRMIDDVDAVFATSERVAKHLRTIGGGRRVEVFPNGFDADHFQQTRDPHPSLSNIPHPRVVYVGAIDQRFDMASSIGLAALRPDLTVILYGPVTIPHPATLPPNLLLMGPLPYQDLPAVLQHCDVALLPLLDIPANQGRSPMKYYEYRAAGPRIVAFATESFHELRDDAGLFLYHRPTSNDLAAAVDRALQNHPDRARADQPLREHAQTWENIAQRMLDRIAEIPLAKSDSDSNAKSKDHLNFG